MAKIIKKIKAMQPNGTWSNYIPIGAEAENVNVDGESVEEKLNKKPYYYNNVADMKADENLKVGDMAITLGYYEVNDGGAAEYKIINIENQISYQEELDNGLYAELLKDQGYVNVKQYGAYGDGVHDDILAINKAINDSYNRKQNFQILFPTGSYIVTDTIELSYLSRVTTNGFVRIFFDSAVEDKPCIHIKEVDTDNYTWSYNFYHSPIIDGTNGALLIYGKATDKKSIGIQYGDLNDTSTGTSGKISPRNAIQFVSIEGFKIGMLYSNSNNYWTHFKEMNFTNCIYGVQFGTLNHTTLVNSNENISFEDCVFGGNGIALYEFFPNIVKFHKTSFDMNNCVLYTVCGGWRYEFYECWIERNGLTSYVNRVDNNHRGIMINESNNYKNIILENCYSTYGGQTEGEQIHNYLFRGKLKVLLNNYMWTVGDNFRGGNLYRLFLFSPDVMINNKNGLISSDLISSINVNDITNGQFENLIIDDALPINVNDTFGNFTVVSRYRVTGTVKASDLLDGKNMLVMSTPGGGYYEFSTDYLECEYGEILRPLIIYKQNDGASLETGACNYWLEFYDENKNMIGEHVRGNNLTLGEDFSYFSSTINDTLYVPPRTKYYKIIFKVNFNGAVERTMNIYSCYVMKEF